MKKFLTLSCILSLVWCVNMNAQNNPTQAEAQRLGYEPYPYWFVQLQGGVGTTFTNVKFTDLISPTASVSVGRWFKPAIGARLHVNGWESKGGFKNGARYKFNYINTDLDLMLNVNNLFSENKNHLVNLVLVGGIGLNYAWDNDELCNLVTSANPPTEATNDFWGKGSTREDLYSHNLRLGAILDFNVSKNWGIGLEVDANNLSDRFNSKYNNSGDWMVTAQLGITYKFGQKKYVAPMVQPEVIDPNFLARQKALEEAEQQKEEAPVVEEEEKVFQPYNAVIYFEIAKRDIRPEYKGIIPAATKWAKENSDRKLVISAYADKGTGNPKINLKYSEERAKMVVEALKAEGVPETQIVVQSYGDTVQPYAENDQNRCVILLGE